MSSFTLTILGVSRTEASALLYDNNRFQKFQFRIGRRAKSGYFRANGPSRLNLNTVRALPQLPVISQIKMCAVRVHMCTQCEQEDNQRMVGGNVQGRQAATSGV